MYGVFRHFVNIFRVVYIPVFFLGPWIKSLNVWSGIITTFFLWFKGGVYTTLQGDADNSYGLSGMYTSFPFLN